MHSTVCCTGTGTVYRTPMYVHSTVCYTYSKLHSTLCVFYSTILHFTEAKPVGDVCWLWVNLECASTLPKVNNIYIKALDISVKPLFSLYTLAFHQL